MHFNSFEAKSIKALREMESFVGDNCSETERIVGEPDSFLQIYWRFFCTDTDMHFLCKIWDKMDRKGFGK